MDWRLRPPFFIPAPVCYTRPIVANLTLADEDSPMMSPVDRLRLRRIQLQIAALEDQVIRTSNEIAGLKRQLRALERRVAIYRPSVTDELPRVIQFRRG
jgi:hypothetical protein